MEPNITLQSPGIAWTPRASARLLAQAVAVAAAVLVVALAIAGIDRGAGVEATPSADLQRWQAVAESYEAAPPVALAAQTARWEAVAASQLILTPARAAEAARWSGLAGAEARLTPGQAAYAARLSGAAIADSTP